MRRSAATTGLVTGVLILGFLVLRGGGGRVIEVPLTNASGLKNGSAVRVHGLTAGRVDLRLDNSDHVIATLKLEKGAPTIRKDASAQIVAANFLGQKRIELDPGKKGREAPDGFRMPASRVSTPTDLDTVLDVFDLDTRLRTQVLLSELGQAVVGRRVDIRTFLHEFPIGVEDAARDLKLLKTDNATMRTLVERSDRFVGEAASHRKQLQRLVDTVGGATGTLNVRRAELRATLARAPGTLRTLRGFLGDLQNTATPLGPAARDITATAPVLDAALDQVPALRKAATPTLATATRVAPRLTALSLGATPVLRRANPAARELATFAETSPKLATTLDRSADNIIPILENWSRAIQFRDQLGHVFRGEAAISPDLYKTMIDRLTAPARKREQTRTRDRAKPRVPTPAGPDPQATKPPKAIEPAQDLVNKLPLINQVTQTLPKLPDVKVPGAAPKAPKDGGQDQDLLDFLLGK